MPKDMTATRIINLKRSFYLKYSIISILIIVVMVLITLIAFKSPWTVDLTADKLFTLSDQTKEIVSSLTQNVEIYAIYPKGSEDPLVTSLLSEYQKLGGPISIEYLDLERDPGRVASLNTGSKSILNGTLIVRSGERIKEIYSSEIFQTTVEGNTFWGESQITGAIRYVTTEVMPTLYFLEGHDEASISDTISHVQSTLQLNVFTVKTLSLIKTGSVPEDAAAVIISSPKRDLSDSEFILLEEYLNKGGNLFVLVDVINSNSMVLERLTALLHPFGIDITNNIMVEEDPYSHLSNNNLYLIPGYIFHPITQDLAESKRYIVLPISMGLHTLDIDVTQVKLEPLLASTQRSWMRTDMSISSTSKTDSDVQGPVALAYASSKVNAESDNLSKVVVIGNSSFIYNENFNSYANRDFFLNCVNWLTGSQQSTEITPRVIGANKFIVRGSIFTRLTLVTLVLMPLIPFGCAFLVWYLRRNK